MPQNSQQPGRPASRGAGSDPVETGQDELVEFIYLIGLLREVLVPVGPAEAFRVALGHDLVAAARARQDDISAHQGWRRLTSPWALLAAAAASAVSVVVGIVTFVIWHRTRPAAG